MLPRTPFELSRLRGGRYAWATLAASPVRCDFLASGDNSAYDRVGAFQIGSPARSPNRRNSVRKYRNIIQIPYSCRVRRKRKRLTSNGSIESDAAVGDCARPSISRRVTSDRDLTFGIRRAGISLQLQTLSREAERICLSV